MIITDLIMPFVFLGDERMANGIYEHMRKDLTAVEQYVLLCYLALPIHSEAKRAFNSAAPSDQEAARRAVMAKFPRTWPPPSPS
ncbi:MAG: hypothetical protein AAB469_01905 [Patescibacteria group bacterium]|mgnify:CR=1 FL=1